MIDFGKFKVATFDCYGTLTNFRMAQVAREIYAGRLTPAQMEAFVEAFVEDLDHSAYLDDDYQVDTEAIQERMDSFREALNIHTGHTHAGYRESFKPSGILAGMDAYRNNR